MKTSTLTFALVAGAASAVAAAPAAHAQCDTPHKPSTVQAAYGSKGGKDIVDTAIKAGSFNTLAAALGAAGLVDALKGDGPFTVFAPTDEAFARLPDGTVDSLLEPENRGLLTAILTYHVVPGELAASDVVARTGASTLNGQRVDIRVNGGRVKIDDATVVKADVRCSNGIIHVIDRVIMPSSDSILKTAAQAGSFETLAAAIEAAGLVKTLSGKGPFTVFAPTDAAFAALPAGTLDSLLKPRNKHRLVSILKYHVVPGRVYAADALAAETAETIEGKRIRFRLNGRGLVVNDAKVLQADIEATNGVIHVIDRVMLPR